MRSIVLSSVDLVAATSGSSGVDADPKARCLHLTFPLVCPHFQTILCCYLDNRNAHFTNTFFRCGYYSEASRSSWYCPASWTNYNNKAIWKSGTHCLIAILYNLMWLLIMNLMKRLFCQGLPVIVEKPPHQLLEWIRVLHLSLRADNYTKASWSDTQRLAEPEATMTLPGAVCTKTSVYLVNRKLDASIHTVVLRRHAQNEFFCWFTTPSQTPAAAPLTKDRSMPSRVEDVHGPISKLVPDRYS